MNWHITAWLMYGMSVMCLLMFMGICIFYDLNWLLFIAAVVFFICAFLAEGLANKPGDRQDTINYDKMRD